MSDDQPWDQWPGDDDDLLEFMNPFMGDDSEAQPEALESRGPSSELGQEIQQLDRSPSGSLDTFLNQPSLATAAAEAGHPPLPAAPLDDDSCEAEYVSAEADGPHEVQTPIPRVTQEQVNRQMQKCLRDGQELSRLLRKGTREWWMGPTNTARKQNLRRRFHAFNTEVTDVYRGRRRIGDVAYDLAAEGIAKVDKGLAPILNNPARCSYNAVVAVAEHTAAPFKSFRRVVRGEHGSQATPCRHQVTDGDGEDGDNVLVDMDPEDGEPATLLGPSKNWKLV